MKAENIKQFRKSLNMTQKELAMELDISTRTVQDWEQGRNNIGQRSDRDIKKFMDSLNDQK